MNDKEFDAAENVRRQAAHAVSVLTRIIETQVAAARKNIETRYSGRMRELRRVEAETLAAVCAEEDRRRGGLREQT